LRVPHGPVTEITVTGDRAGLRDREPRRDARPCVLSGMAGWLAGRLTG